MLHMSRCYYQKRRMKHHTDSYFFSPSNRTILPAWRRSSKLSKCCLVCNETHNLSQGHMMAILLSDELRWNAIYSQGREVIQSLKCLWVLFHIYTLKSVIVVKQNNDHHIVINPDSIWLSLHILIFLICVSQIKLLKTVWKLRTCYKD